MSKDRLPFQQVVDTLRGEILDGDLAVGARVPTQFELAERFGVSRATVQRALGELRDGGYITSHQGQGTFVADWKEASAEDGAPRPPEMAVVSLAKSLEAAFRCEEVTIDAFSLTAETLNSALAKPLVSIQTGGFAPRRIRVRLILASISTNLAIPRSTDGADDPRPLERLRRLARSHRLTMVNSLLNLKVADLVPEVEVEVREVPITPLQKFYILNGVEVLSGYYRIVPREVPIGDEYVSIFDVLGLGSTVFRHVKGEPDTGGKAFVDETREFFDSLWHSIATVSAVDE